MNARDGGEILAQAERIVGFPGVVQLVERPLAELLQHADQVNGADVFRAGGDHAGGILHNADIGLHLRVDIRALHLHRDRSAVVQRRAMHLRGRGRGKGLRVESRIEFFRRRPKLLDDDLPHLIAGEGWDIALELHQLRLPIGRNRRRLAGDDLADLHIGRAELLKHQPHLDRQGGRLQILRQTPDPGLHRTAEIADHRPPVEEDIRAVAQQRVVHLLEAQVFADLIYTGASHASPPAATCAPASIDFGGTAAASPGISATSADWRQAPQATASDA